MTTPSVKALAATTVAVAPTSTLLCTIECRSSSRVTLQVVNTDGSQTFVGEVRRRTQSETTYAPSTLGDFSSVGPGSSVMADLDVEGTEAIQLWGTMSGAGGNVRVSAQRRAAP